MTDRQLHGIFERVRNRQKELVIKFYKYSVYLATYPIACPAVAHSKLEDLQD